MYEIILGCLLLIIYQILRMIKDFNKPIIISIDGNIGSGKSTLIKLMRCSVFFEKYNFVDEPIKEWVKLKDQNEKNLLQNFYEDKSRWSYSFQNYAFITRTQYLLDVISEINKYNFINQFKNFIIGKKNICFTERSTLTDRYVFATMLHDDGDMNDLEWQMYLDWYNLFKNQIEISHIFYIQTNPEVSFERVNKRSRFEEKTISQDYLTKLHSKHEKWLSIESNVLKINGNLDFENNQDNLHCVFNQMAFYLKTRVNSQTSLKNPNFNASIKILDKILMLKSYFYG